MRYFAISDIHGNIKKLESLLQYHDPDKEKIVLLGDLIDRGDDSYLVLKRAIELEKEYGAIVLRGNHEQLFIGALDDPEGMMVPYINNGGDATIDSLLGRTACYRYLPRKIVEMISETHSEIISFIKTLEFYHEDNKTIFVHAGVNTTLENWKETSNSDFLNIRNKFIFGTNKTGKTIVFGHTETRLINGNRNNGIWISECKTKIGIDGNASGGGILNGVILEDGQIIEVRET